MPAALASQQAGKRVPPPSPKPQGLEVFAGNRAPVHAGFLIFQKFRGEAFPNGSLRAGFETMRNDAPSEIQETDGPSGHPIAAAGVSPRAFLHMTRVEIPSDSALTPCLVVTPRRRVGGSVPNRHSLSHQIEMPLPPSRRLQSGQPKACPRSQGVTARGAMLSRDFQYGQQNAYRRITPGGDPGCGAAREPRRGI